MIGYEDEVALGRLNWYLRADSSLGRRNWEKNSQVAAAVARDERRGGDNKRGKETHGEEDKVSAPRGG